MMAASNAAPSIDEVNPIETHVTFNTDVKLLHTMAQKLYSDIETKGSGFIRSPDNLQTIIDSITNIASGMSGEDSFLKHINMLLCELKVLKIVLLKSFGKAEEELKRLSSSLTTKNTTSRIYLDEFLKHFTERESLDEGKVAEVAEHYQAKVEMNVKKLCAFLKENIVEETMETEQENDDPVSNDSKDAMPTESSSSPVITKSELTDAKEPKTITIRVRSRRSLWSYDAVAALVDGVNRFGVGNWKRILESKSAKKFPTSNNVAIKDKWRNLVKYEHVIHKNGRWIHLHDDS
ncbi:PREDICTED: uncharacterized protein LOC100633593 [Amphimedon queenslandica]|uniref:Myb-like domain-containing protein n=2 Tax=Amphimedon queenslandica TaxID=400682 RepID=A0AAN0IE27_AMPQE|nr:PREDICTED: uncharacterized protein LOC100633593 [Amphimedon queenslandica]|eukprot:XP_003386559.2 PREDICTED: uncharacterized protein LOC100633593 [Amphimedon queenslandica]